MSPPTLALAGLLSLNPIAVETSLTTWLVLDPNAANQLQMTLPGGETVATPLSGGVLATVTVDLLALALNLPTVAEVQVEEIRIAGESFAPVPALPSLQTGTLCVSADPQATGGGAVALPAEVPPRITISTELATRTVALGPLGAALPGDGIPLSAAIEDEVQADLRTLLVNELGTGPVAVDTEAEGVVPPDVLLIGGQPFRIDLRILNSLSAPSGPLLDECAAAGIH